MLQKYLMTTLRRPDTFIVAALYVLSGNIGFFTSLLPDVPTLWPPAGIAIGLLLLHGKSLWRGIFLGAFLLHLLQAASLVEGHSLTTLLKAAGLAGCATVQALLGAHLIEHYVGLKDLFHREAHVLKFAVIALAVSALDASLQSIGTFVGYAAQMPGFASVFAPAWENTGVSSFVGIVAFVPLLFAMSELSRQPWEYEGVTEAILIGLLLYLSCIAIFRGTLYNGDNFYRLVFILIILHLWATLRFGLLGTLLSFIGIALFSIWGAKDGYGLFYRSNINESVFVLRNYLIWIPIAGTTYCSTMRRRNQIEDELRGNMEIYQNIFERAPGGKVQLDPLTTRFLRVNRRFCDMLGYSDEELLGMTFLDVIYPNDRDKGLTASPPKEEGENCEYSIERRLFNRNGTIFWGLINVSLIKDNCGNDLYMIANIHDRNTFRNADDKLRISEERARLAVEAASLGTFDYNLITNELFLSNQAKKMLGVLSDRQVTFHDFVAALQANDTPLDEDPIKSLKNTPTTVLIGASIRRAVSKIR